MPYQREPWTPPSDPKLDPLRARLAERNTADASRMRELAPLLAQPGPSPVRATTQALRLQRTVAAARAQHQGGE